MGAKLRPKMQERRLKLAAAGKTAGQIAESEGAKITTIRSWARKQKIKLAEAKRGRRNVGWEACFERGLTVAEAAKELGSTIHAGWSWSHRQGVKWPVPEPLTEAQKADIRVLVRRGGYSTAQAKIIAMQPKVRFGGPTTEIQRV